MQLDKKNKLTSPKPTTREHFQPFPFSGNAHIQTLLGALLDASPLEFPSKEVIVPVSDGDALLVYDSKPAAWTPGLPIVILVHGLTGSHRSNHVVRVGESLYRKGCRVIRINQRGAGPGIHLARLSYHAGRSEDVRCVMKFFQNEADPSPQFLIGFSLGANIILKLAGENEETQNLAGIVAMAPPINLKLCSDLLEKKSNQIYEKHFLSNLITETKKRQKFFPDLPPLHFPSNMSIRLFDEYYTAPRAGFTCADQYYEESSAEKYLKNITVPTFILTSKDDPFICFKPFENLEVPDCVTLCAQNHGGHLGFFGSDGNGGHRWGESKIIQWIEQHLVL